ncbi:unnamed protein product, partial [Arctia plantaginis]
MLSRPRLLVVSLPESGAPAAQRAPVFPPRPPRAPPPELELSR